MSYLRISDDIEDHPAFALLSDRAFRVWVYAGAWCQRHLTDGVIPQQLFRDLRRSSASISSELLAAGLIQTLDGGAYYALTGFLKHNDSREVVQSRRAAIAGRQRKWKDDKRRVSNASPNASPNASLSEGVETHNLTSPNLTPLKEGAGADFWEDFRRLYARFNAGAQLPLEPRGRDIDTIVRLTTTYSLGQLSELAEMFFRLDVPDLRDKVRSVGLFAHWAPKCDAIIRKARGAA